MNVIKAMLFLLFLAYAMDNELFEISSEEFKNKVSLNEDLPVQVSAAKKMSYFRHLNTARERIHLIQAKRLVKEFLTQKYENVQVFRMEEEDLFKLSERDFYKKANFPDTLQANLKRNKGTFFKATNGKKTIYFLGSIHHYIEQDFFDYTMNKIEEKLKKDGNQTIQTLWTEADVSTGDDLLDYEKYMINHCGLKADNVHLQKYFKKCRELIDCRVDERFFKALVENAQIVKFLDTDKCNERISSRFEEIFDLVLDYYEQNLKHVLDFFVFPEYGNFEIVDAYHCPLKTVNTTARAYHRGDLLKLALTSHLWEDEKATDDDEFYETEARNKDWVDLLKSENSDVQFIIAGALHVLHNTGVPMLLQKEGWQIEHVDLDIPDRFTGGLDESLYHYQRVHYYAPEFLFKPSAIK